VVAILDIPIWKLSKRLLICKNLIVVLNSFPSFRLFPKFPKLSKTETRDWAQKMELLVQAPTTEWSCRTRKRRIYTPPNKGRISICIIFNSEMSRMNAVTWARSNHKGQQKTILVQKRDWGKRNQKEFFKSFIVHSIGLHKNVVLWCLNFELWYTTLKTTNQRNLDATTFELSLHLCI